MTIEPDEDEDPTRICVKCGVRPRWSRHGTCRRCVVCAGSAVSRCIRIRKGDDPPELSTVPRSVVQRQRYAALKELGLSPREAWRAARSSGPYERAMVRLRGEE